MSGEDYDEAVKTSIRYLRHVHISEVGYGLTGSSGVGHERLAAALRHFGYSGVASIEMISARHEGNIDRVSRALEYVASMYLSR